VNRTRDEYINKLDRLINISFHLSSIPFYSLLTALHFCSMYACQTRRWHDGRTNQVIFLCKSLYRRCRNASLSLFNMRILISSDNVVLRSQHGLNVFIFWMDDATVMLLLPCLCQFAIYEHIVHSILDLGLKL
jgi:hypothetical protein